MRKILVILLFVLSLASCTVWDCIVSDYEPIASIDSVEIEVPIYVPIPIDSVSIVDSIRLMAELDFSSLRGIIDSLTWILDNTDPVSDIIYFPVDIRDDSLSVETNIAEATAYIINSKLGLDLINKQDSLLYKVSYYKHNYQELLNDYNDIYRRYEILEANKKSRFAYAIQGLLVGILIGIIIMFVIIRKLKRM